MLKKLFGRIGLYGLAPHVPKIASIFILPIITKSLTPSDYGIYGLITAYTAALGALQTLGINVVLANSFYKSPNQYKWLWRQIHGFMSLYSVFFAFVLATILYFVIPEEANENKLTLILLVCSPIALFSATETIVFRFFHLSQKALNLALRTVFIGFLTVFLNWYTISVLKLGYMGWFYTTFITSIVSFVIYAYAIYFKYKLTPIFNFKRKTIKNVLRISLPTVPHFYSGYLLNTSNRVVMDINKVNVGSIGLFNLAATFGGYFSILGDALGMAVSPIYLQLFKKAEKPDTREAALEQVRFITFLLQAIFFVLAFVVSIWIKEIFFVLIKNEELRKSYVLAIILIMGYCYRPMYLGVINRYFYLEKSKSLWKISFVAGVLNVLLNLIFIPLFGVNAAALVTFFSLLYMGYSGYFLKEYKAIRTLNYYPAYWLIANIGLAVLAYVVAETFIYVKILTTIALLAVLGYLFLKNKKNLGLALD
ncbi:oligosaccharide flippase family protein [Nibribacter ruber]|uniref:Oligosaccharide flippase family protein n=1 Tax=Nibribacter ruber TaxID=2698458 RepID=A0A6P1P3P0_9BACT|nr:oligosaccharide flippase family protein [Nibribacter ruber]QHL89049.1 oligosaccharide flippase family protein [Nibribacter ruber]